MLGRKSKLRRKQYKLELDFVLGCLSIILGAVISFCYFMSYKNYLAAAFTIIFTYYVIKLYALNYYDID